MLLLKRILERLFIAILSVAFIWFAVTQVFKRLDQRMPVFLAAVATYFLAAYLIFPPVIQFGTMILRRGHIPRFTKSSDGLIADPVNIILICSEENLRKIFKKISWHEADNISVISIWKMIRAILSNRPYPNAPFSRLYLFGRKQDYGFQQSIGSSLLQRHHIRFWAANLNPDISYTDIRYWMGKHKIDHNKPVMWVGAATKDIGLGLKKLTYQITHKTDKNIDEERNYVISLLREAGVIAKEEFYEPAQFINKKYISDGRILVASLKEESKQQFMIETKRLKLREFTADDVDSLAAIFADHETMKFYPATKDREETVRWIEKNVERYKKYGFGLWAVVRKDNDEFIGDCGITMQNIDGEEKPEIGYHIRRDYWGQGYATEAASACKEHAFNKLGLEEAFSYMRSDNLASRRVAEKIGMTLRKEYINNGYPTVIYSIKKLPI